MQIRRPSSLLACVSLVLLTDSDGDGDGEPTGDGDGDPCDACDPLQLCHDQACVPAAQIIYLNFDAEGDFSYSADQPADARINRHDISTGFVGALPSFNGDAFERQQILDRVRADFAELRVIVTDERPPDGQYSMIVFTEHPSGSPNVVAMPRTDCGDQNANDVAFNDGDPVFVDQCLPLPDTLTCDFNHMLHCQGKGMQNSWSELEAAWGF
jgi:hypothetical protein